jgi:hypothetical protein
MAPARVRNCIANRAHPPRLCLALFPIRRSLRGRLVGKNHCIQRMLFRAPTNARRKIGKVRLGGWAAAPARKKVPATVTAGTEVWGSLAPQCTVRLQLPQASPDAH